MAGKFDAKILRTAKKEKVLNFISLTYVMFHTALCILVCTWFGLQQGGHIAKYGGCGR
jgi:hypothetical protein